MRVYVSRPFCKIEEFKSKEIIDVNKILLKNEKTDYFKYYLKKQNYNEKLRYSELKDKLNKDSVLYMEMKPEGELPAGIQQVLLRGATGGFVGSKLGPVGTGVGVALGALYGFYEVFTNPDKFSTDTKKDSEDYEILKANIREAPNSFLVPEYFGRFKVKPVNLEDILVTYDVETDVIGNQRRGIFVRNALLNLIVGAGDLDFDGSTFTGRGPNPYSDVSFYTEEQEVSQSPDDQKSKRRTLLGTRRLETYLRFDDQLRYELARENEDGARKTPLTILNTSATRKYPKDASYTFKTENKQEYSLSDVDTDNVTAPSSELTKFGLTNETEPRKAIDSKGLKLAKSVTGKFDQFEVDLAFSTKDEVPADWINYYYDINTVNAYRTEKELDDVVERGYELTEKVTDNISNIGSGEENIFKITPENNIYKSEDLSSSEYSKNEIGTKQGEYYRDGSEASRLFFETRSDTPVFTERNSSAGGSEATRSLVSGKQEEDFYGKFYAISNNGYISSVSTTGVATRISNNAINSYSGFTSLTWDGEYFWAGDEGSYLVPPDQDQSKDRLFWKINKQGASVESIRTSDVFVSLLDINGSLYTIESSLKRVNKVNGNITNIGGSFSGTCEGMAWDGEYIWALISQRFSYQPSQLYRVNRSNGSSTLIGGTLTENGVNINNLRGLTWDGTNLIAVDRTKRYIVNKQTARFTNEVSLSGESDYDFRGLDYVPIMSSRQPAPSVTSLIGTRDSSKDFQIPLSNINGSTFGNNKLYFTRRSDNQFYETNLDGTGLRQEFFSGISNGLCYYDNKLFICASYSINVINLDTFSEDTSRRTDTTGLRSGSGRNPESIAVDGTHVLYSYLPNPSNGNINKISVFQYSESGTLTRLSSLDFTIDTQDDWGHFNNEITSMFWVGDKLYLIGGTIEQPVIVYKRNQNGTYYRDRSSEFSFSGFDSYIGVKSGFFMTPYIFINEGSVSPITFRAFYGIEPAPVLSKLQKPYDRFADKMASDGTKIFADAGNNIDTIDFDLNKLENGVINISNRDMIIEGMDYYNNILVVLWRETSRINRYIDLYDATTYRRLKRISPSEINEEETNTSTTDPRFTTPNRLAGASGKGASGKIFGIVLAGFFAILGLAYLYSRYRSRNTELYTPNENENQTSSSSSDTVSRTTVSYEKIYNDIAYNGEYFFLITNKSIETIRESDEDFSSTNFSEESVRDILRETDYQPAFISCFNSDGYFFLTGEKSNYFVSFEVTPVRTQRRSDLDVSITKDATFNTVNSFRKSSTSYYLYGNDTTESFYKLIEVPVGAVTTPYEPDLPAPMPDPNMPTPIGSNFDIVYEDEVTSDASDTNLGLKLSFTSDNNAFTLANIASGNKLKFSTNTTIPFKARDLTTRLVVSASNFEITSSDYSSLSAGSTDINISTGNFVTTTRTLDSILNIISDGTNYFMIVSTASNKVSRKLYSLTKAGSKNTNGDFTLQNFTAISKTAKSGRTLSARKLKLTEAKFINDRLWIPYVQEYTDSSGLKDTFYFLISFDKSGNFLSDFVIDLGNKSETSATDSDLSGVSFNFDSLNGSFTDGVDFFIKDESNTYRAFNPVFDTQINGRHFSKPSVPSFSGFEAGEFAFASGNKVWLNGRNKTLYAYGLVSPSNVEDPNDAVDFGYESSKNIIYETEVSHTDGLRFSFIDGVNVYTESSPLSARSVSNSANITFACRHKDTKVRISSNDITITKSGLTSLQTKNGFTGTNLSINSLKNVFLNGSYIYLYFDIAVAGGTEEGILDQPSGKTDSSASYSMFAFNKSTGARSSSNDISLSDFTAVTKTVPSGRVLNKKEANLKDSVFFNNKLYVLCNQSYQASSPDGVTRFDFLLPFSLTGTGDTTGLIDLRRMEIATDNTETIERGIGLGADTSYRSLFTDNTDIYIKGTGYENHEAFFAYNPTSKLIVRDKSIGIPSQSILGSSTLAVNSSSFNVSDGSYVWFNGKNKTLFAFNLSKSLESFSNNYYIDLYLERDEFSRSFNLDLPFEADFYFNNLQVTDIANVSNDYRFNIETLKIIFRLTREQFLNISRSSEVSIRDKSGTFIFSNLQTQRQNIILNNFNEKYIDDNGNWILISPRDRGKMPVFVLEIEGATNTGVEIMQSNDGYEFTNLTLSGSNSSSYYYVFYPRAEDLRAYEQSADSFMNLIFPSNKLSASEDFTGFKLYRYNYEDFNPKTPTTLSLGGTLPRGNSITYDTSDDGALDSSSNITFNNNLVGLDSRDSDTNIFGCGGTTVYKYGLSGGASSLSSSVSGITGVYSVSSNEDLIVLSNLNIHILAKSDLTEDSSRKTLLGTEIPVSSSNNEIASDGTHTCISFNQTVDSVKKCFIKVWDNTDTGAFTRNSSFDFNFDISTEFTTDGDVNSMFFMDNYLFLINTDKDKAIVFAKFDNGFIRYKTLDITLASTTGSLQCAFRRLDKLYLGNYTSPNTVARALTFGNAFGTGNEGVNPIFIYPQRILFSKPINRTISTIPVSLLEISRQEKSSIYVGAISEKNKDKTDEELKEYTFQNGNVARFFFHDSRSQIVKDAWNDFTSALTRRLFVYAFRKVFNPDADATNTIRSNNPADICLHILNELHTQIDSPVSFSDFVDITSFNEFKTHCQTNGYEFNGFFDRQGTFLETLSVVANAGRGILIHGFGKIKIHIDRAQSTVAQHFDATSMSDISISKPAVENYNFLEARYWDEDQDYTKQTLLSSRINPNDTVNNYTKSFDLKGITNRTKVMDYLNFRSKKLRYAGEVYKLRVDLPAVRCSLGDLIGINYEIVEESQFSGRVLETVLSPSGLVTGVIIDTKNTPDLDSNETYVFTVLKMDGTINNISVSSITNETKTNNLRTLNRSELEEKLKGNSPRVTSRGRTFKKINFTSPQNTSQVAVDDKFGFGKTGNSYKRAVVVGIQSNGDLTGTITAIEYFDEVYT